MLELKDVTGGHGRITILNGTSFQISKASITPAIGPNGAGKSTVLNASFGLLNIHSGQILLEGEEVTRKRPAERIARGVPCVPHGRNVGPQLSVLHNLELGGLTARDQSRVLARMEQVMDLFPMLRQRKDQMAIELSGGQRKRLEIARAGAGSQADPDRRALDRAFAEPGAREVFPTLIQLRDQGVTILMVEQNAKAALAMSDYGLVLDLGQTRMVDRAATLLAAPRVGQLFLGGPIEDAA